MEQRMVCPAQNRQRRIYAHGRNGLPALQRHGQDACPEFIIGVSKGFLHPLPFLIGKYRHPSVGNFQAFQGDHIAVQPFAVRLSGSIGFLQTVILYDPALHGIHQQHFPRMETLFFHNFRRVDLQHSHFGGQDQLIIVCNIIPGGTQAIPIQHRPHHIAVGKDNRGRPVPWLHHGCIILVKIFFLLTHGAVIRPGLRNGDHHRQRQIHTAHHKKFQRIVQHGRIRSGSVDGRKHLVELSQKRLRFHIFFSGQHLVRIAPYGIDFPVVHNQAIGMGPLPAGIRIGGKAGMYHRNGRIIVPALEIPEKSPELTHQKHPLVDNGPAGQGNHISIVCGLLENTAQNIQKPVKGQPFFHPVRFPDKSLHNTGHTRQRLMPQNLRFGGHSPPAQKFQAFLLNDDFKHLFGLVPFQFILGKEKHPDAIFPLSAQGNPQRLRHFRKKAVRNLYQNTHAVACLALCVLTGPVLQIFHYFQGILHDLMAFHAPDIDTGANAAVVMLKALPIQRRG